MPPTQGDKFAVGGRVIEQKDARIKAWRRMIATECRQVGWEPVLGPVSLTLVFHLPRPASHYGTGRNAGMIKPGRPDWCATKPDVDKLARAVLDALTKCGAIGDDATVVELKASKWYTGTDGWVGVHIRATPINDHNA